MKKSLLFIGLTSIVFALPVAADETPGAWKETAVLFTTSILGAAAAGPFGLVAGAMGGTWIAGNVNQANEAVSLREDIADAQRQGEIDGRTIARLERNLDQVNEALASKLEFQVLFATGKDEMIEDDLIRLNMLAGYLLRNDQLQVRLDGYADPRGTDEYNNVLAMYRAENVAAALNEMGVPKSRIEIYHHGAINTPTASLAADAHALQRRVDIQVYQPETSQLALEP
jgi:outer membrane protein OmpA-like peptidoglycan-associated protein